VKVRRLRRLRQPHPRFYLYTSWTGRVYRMDASSRPGKALLSWSAFGTPI